MTNFVEYKVARAEWAGRKVLLRRVYTRQLNRAFWAYAQKLVERYFEV